MTKLPKDWQEWLADCLMRQIPHQDILSYMQEQLFEEEFAKQALLEASEHPFIRAGLKIAREKYRRDWCLKLFQTIRENAKDNQLIDYYKTIDRDTFYKHYQANNKPVILTNMIDDWYIYKNWTPEYFKEKFGQKTVQVTRRDGAMSSRYHVELLMSEFINTITSIGEANDWYLSFGNYQYNKEPLKEMFAEIDKLPEILNPYAEEEISGQVFLGPSGTLTDLHFDLANAIYAQIYGRKKFILIPPEYITNVYPYGNLLSKVDMENIDYEKFPYFKGAKKYEVTLNPGEIMYLPIGWWHSVVSEGVSISLSFSNFYTKEKYILFENLFQKDPEYPPYDDAEDYKTSVEKIT